MHSMAEEFDVTIGPDGRVAVPDAVRDHLGVGTGEAVRFLLHDDGLVEVVAPRVPEPAVDPTVFSGPPEQVVAVLSRGVPAAAAQTAGLALLLALEQDVPGAADLAPAAADVLEGRGWPGDSQLAGLLRDRAAGIDRGRPTVPADLEPLAEVLDSDTGIGGYLNLDDGSVWPFEVFDVEPELAPDLEGPEWVYVQSEGSRAAWLDMQDFALQQDPPVRRRMLAAIEGKGAFRRFREVLHDEAEQVTAAWYLFRDERAAGRAVEWLSWAGLDVAARGDDSPAG